MELIIISGNLTANPQSRIIDGKEIYCRVATLSGGQVNSGK